MRRALLLLAVLALTVPLMPAGWDTSGAGIGGAQPAGPSDEDGVTTVPDDMVLYGGGIDAVLQLAALAPADTAVLVTMEDFADALASGVLQRDAVLLPSRRDALVEGVSALIAAEGISQVIVIGGTAAISDQAVAQLPAGVAVTRIAGAERTETAARIAEATTAGSSPARVLLARARGTADNPSSGFIDAVAAGAWSAATGWPVLLVDAAGPSPATTAVMAALDPEEVIVLGGTAAISEQAAATTADGRPITRIAGGTRYDTAAGIAALQQPEGAQTVFLLDGTDPQVWQPGLAAAHPAAVEDGVVLLADGPRLPEATRTALAAAAPATIHCIAQAEVCLQAREAAGLPPAIDLVIEPSPGRTLDPDTTVTVRADGELSVVDDGGCIAFDTPADPSTLTGRASGGDCTIAVRARAPGRVGQTTTISWPSLGADRDVAVGPADYALQEVGNRWDYDEAIDARVDALLGDAAGGARVDVASGVLDLGTAGNRVTVPLLWPGFPGAVPVSPDGLEEPINADHYRIGIFRLHSPVASRLDLEWRTCAPAPEGNCIGAPVKVGRASAALQPGWQTVVIDLSQQGAWSGQVHFLYLSAAGGTRVDDVRLVPALSGAVIPVQAAPGEQLVWDRDADPSNNTDPASPDFGLLTEGRLDADLLPPGQYWVHTGQGGTVGPLTLATPPAAIVTSPSVDTAVEFGRDVRGNPWDMAAGAGPAGTDDLAEIGGVIEAGVADGVLRATNRGNDPYIVLAGAGPFDPQGFHTVTVDFAVDGPLDLSFDPGGGTHARILYTHQGDVHWRDGAPLVAYTNQRSYTVDMRHPAATAQGPVWTAGTITGLRFDPNEDPGDGRGWTVADVRITGDVHSPGEVTLSVRDAGVDAGVPREVTFHASQDRAALGGAVAGPVTMAGAEAAVPWRTCGLAPGRWWVTAIIAGAGADAHTSRVPVLVSPC